MPPSRRFVVVFRRPSASSASREMRFPEASSRALSFQLEARRECDNTKRRYELRYKIRIFFSLSTTTASPYERFETREKAKRRETERVFVRSFSPRKVEKVSVRAYEEVSFPVQVELWECGIYYKLVFRTCVSGQILS